LTQTESYKSSNKKGGKKSYFTRLMRIMRVIGTNLAKQKIDWFEPYDKVLDESDAPFTNGL